MQRSKLLHLLHEYLEVEKFSDYCINGLQVEGSEHIKKIALATSLTENVCFEAVKHGCDTLILHHGLFWRGECDEKGITGIFQKRLSYILKHNLNIIAYHLPLDAHDEIGNNVVILKALGCHSIEDFGKEKNNPMIGKIGVLEKKYSQKKFIDFVHNTLGIHIGSLMYGNTSISRVAVISGGAVNMIDQTLGKADVFLSGEIREYTPAFCKEMKQNCIGLGHYNSEIHGVRELGTYISNNYGIETHFIHENNVF